MKIHFKYLIYSILVSILAPIILIILYLIYTHFNNPNFIPPDRFIIVDIDTKIIQSMKDSLGKFEIVSYNMNNDFIKWGLSFKIVTKDFYTDQDSLNSDEKWAFRINTPINEYTLNLINNEDTIDLKDVIINGGKDSLYKRMNLDEDRIMGDSGVSYSRMIYIINHYPIDNIYLSFTNDNYNFWYDGAKPIIIDTNSAIELKLITSDNTIYKKIKINNK